MRGNHIIWFTLKVNGVKTSPSREIVGQILSILGAHFEVNIWLRNNHCNDCVKQTSVKLKNL